MKNEGSQFIGLNTSSEDRVTLTNFPTVWMAPVTRYFPFASFTAIVDLRLRRGMD